MTFAAFHDELRAVARQAMAGSTPLTRAGDPAVPDWDLLARSGWLGLEVPETLDGTGATFAETAVVLRELGRAGCRSGYLSSAVLGVGALLLLEPGQERDDLLRSAASGQCRLAVALPAWEELTEAPWGSFRLETGGASGSAGAVHGRADFVLDAADADTQILFAEQPDGEVAAVLVDASSPKLDVVPTEVIDTSRDFATVTAGGAEVAASLIGAFAGDPADGLRSLLDRAALAVACDSLGLAEMMLEATVSYTGLRHQFGRPVGSFQAVKHACADMYVKIRVAGELVDEAVEALVALRPEAPTAVSRAKSFACQVAVEVAGKAMQLHGGIGYTWESGIHAYLKRAAINRSMFGSAAAHRRRIAAAFGVNMRSK